MGDISYTDWGQVKLIEERIKERDIGAYVDDLWNRIGGKLKAKNVTPVTINKTIKASREKLSWVKPIH